MDEQRDISIFWFRRDLRLFDNAGLYKALNASIPVRPIFIFDKDILDELEDEKDARVQFIHQEITGIKEKLREKGSDLEVFYGKPKEIWQELLKAHRIKHVYINRDYEPYARKRDKEIYELLQSRGVDLHHFKDQVIFDRKEIMKDDGEPYVVYTPYSRKWLAALQDADLKAFPSEDKAENLLKFTAPDPPSLEDMGFQSFPFDYPSREVDIEQIKQYGNLRDLPAKDATSRLSLHLRFGTVSIRNLTGLARKYSKVWLNELIWRNFYQMIIWNFPDKIENAFKSKYDLIAWRDDEKAFKAWCEGKTGYPLVDAGMRQLNETGFMHNRVRMVTASFLTKHLLVDWRLGEAYFARKLLDFELASNNGGWQWASGSGCDAAPYFRVFNPELQQKKFDPDLRYIKKWVPEFGTSRYPKQIVEHKFARERALSTYKEAVQA